MWSAERSFMDRRSVMLCMSVQRIYDSQPFQPPHPNPPQRWKPSSINVYRGQPKPPSQFVRTAHGAPPTFMTLKYSWYQIIEMVQNPHIMDRTTVYIIDPEAIKDIHWWRSFLKFMYIFIPPNLLALISIKQDYWLTLWGRANLSS